jgi:hypothetical protein
VHLDVTTGDAATPFGLQEDVALTGRPAVPVVKQVGLRFGLCRVSGCW